MNYTLNDLMEASTQLRDILENEELMKKIGFDNDMMLDIYERLEDMEFNITEYKESIWYVIYHRLQTLSSNH